MDLAGINGVPWDAVELPTDFRELVLDGSGLNAISGHYETDAPLPEAFRENLLAARNFHRPRAHAPARAVFFSPQTPVEDVTDLPAVLELYAGKPPWPRRFRESL